MKIVIVGSGAIGRLFGASLAKAGNSVAVIDSNPIVVSAIGKKGIGVLKISSKGLERVERIRVDSYTDPSQIQDCDLILLTVKSFATRQAAESVSHLVTPDSPIVFIQTGLGNQAILREMFPVKAIIAGLTFMSGTALGNSRVRQGRYGLTFLGELGEVGELTGAVTPRLKNICQVFIQSEIDTKWSHKIIGRLWAKVITYATLNTLSSIFKVPNGALLEEPESVRLIKQLLAEGETVARARGVEPIMDDLYELFIQVVQESSGNLSSMLQDILNDRPTEIDAQSGAIAEYAKKFGIEVPRHQMMTSIIKLLAKWPIER